MSLAVTDLDDQLPNPLHLIPAYASEGSGYEQAMHGVAPSSGTWPTSARAVFIPFYLPDDETAKRLFYITGTSAGNGAKTVDLGIYLAPTDGTLVLKLLVSTGSTIISATASATHFIDITDTFLARGEYYLAMVYSSSVTITCLRHQPTGSLGRMEGIATMNTASPLPDPATVVLAATTVTVPVCGISFRASP